MYSDVIKKATDLIIKYEHCKLAMCLDKDKLPVSIYSSEIRYIDMTAALIIANDYFYDSELFAFIGGFCNAANPNTNSWNVWSPWHVSQYNDKNSTTKKQIINLLNEAYIVALQEEGKEPEEVLCPKKKLTHTRTKTKRL